MGRTDRMPFRRPRTPIFDALAARYTTRGGWPSNTEENWALGAFMRGFTYGLRLQEALGPPARRPAYYPPPSPWDAIDATPNEHDPNL